MSRSSSDLIEIFQGDITQLEPNIHAGTRFLRGRRDFIYLFFVVVFLIFAVRFPHEVAALTFVAYGLSGIFFSFTKRGRGKEPPETETETMEEP